MLLECMAGMKLYHVNLLVSLVKHSALSDVPVLLYARLVLRQVMNETRPHDPENSCDIL